MAFATSSPEGIQVYQKNMHHSEEKKLSLANDINRYRNADNLWDILRAEFSLPHYEDNPLVRAQIQYLLSNPDFLMHSAERAGPYLFYILQQVRKRHLPVELALLPMIESAYNPFAYSTAGAGGIWQIMPNTASGFGIKQNWWYDGRRDVVASTKAALDYLYYLGSFFEGNWLLAIAAYNTGEGNVLSAIKRNYRDGYRTDFWSLPVAQQTRDYVPRLLALAIIISHPERYPLDFPPVQNAPYLAQVDIGGQIDLKHAAYLAGLQLKELMRLNPGYNRNTTDPHGPFKIVLPIENVQQFTENLERSPLYQQINWSRYKIKQGDTLVTIAKKFNTTPKAIRHANPLLARNMKPGKKLLIPNKTPSLSQSIMELEKNNIVAESNNHTNPTSFIQVDSEGHYTMQSGDTLYMVRNGDDLKKIANRFQISSSTLVTVNSLRSNNLRPGQQLIIPTHTQSEQKTYELTPGDTIYMVRSGDTIDKIAQKFHLPAAHIRLANLMASNDVQEGDRLIIPTHG